jgi:hypothetical protein
MIHVKVILNFGPFERGQELAVDAAFVERFGRYLAVEFYEDDEPVEDVIAAFEKGLADGEGDHRQAESEGAGKVPRTRKNKAADPSGPDRGLEEAAG